jgi:NADPH:quinone reductase-like Zn-dependent oxidoreductase
VRMDEALVAERPGKLGEVLALRRVGAPGPPEAGEVDVRMLASTINPSDAVTVSGAYASRTEFPFIPGFEGVGVIERAGPGVPAGAIGSRVLPLGSAGNWQTTKRTAYSWCLPVPDDIPEAAACFAYINPLTALLMVRRYCSGAVRNVAITAATSTIAGHLAELLAARGIRPIGLIRGTPGRAVADPGLWKAVIGTDDAAWPEHLGEAAGGGLDVVLDCVGGAQGAAAMRRLRPGGVLVHYGLLSGTPLPAECFAGHEGRRAEMFRLRDAVHAESGADLPDLMEPVFEHLRAGRLRTRVAERVALAELPRTLGEGAGVGRGKLLITYGG